jgi:DNA-binding NarL/FixJ family response regulator
MYTVAIVDDHFAVLDGYKFLLQKLPFISTIHCFYGEQDFMIEMKKIPYDLVLLDISLKDGDGLQICKQLKLHFKKVKVIMLSGHHNKNYLFKAYINDANGYLFKDADSNEVRFAIERVLTKDEKHFNLEAMEAILIQQDAIKTRNKNSKITLSEREIEIVIYICEGKSNKKIGELLNRSEHTILAHKTNIMKKLGVHKSIDITNYAIREGIFIP